MSILRKPLRAAMALAAAVSIQPAGSTPQQFSAHIRSETAKWAKLARDAGLELRH